jgi:hypothetical protein
MRAGKTEKCGDDSGETTVRTCLSCRGGTAPCSQGSRACVDSRGEADRDASRHPSILRPERPLGGTCLACKPSGFPAQVPFANRVVAVLPYYSVPALGQYEPQSVVCVYDGRR